MKLLILSTFVSAVIVAAFTVPVDNEVPKADYDEYLRQYGKSYPEAEKNLRETIFHMRMDSINKHNQKYARGEVTHKVGPNIFTDMTDEEKKKYMGAIVEPRKPLNSNRNKRGLDTSVLYGYNMSSPTYYVYQYDSSVISTLPASIDYATSGWTEPVRNQGNCGSCWAFSSSSALSYYVYKTTGANVELSPQNLVDCSGIWGNQGCNGGSANGAFDYFQVNKDALESAYPYTGIQASCNNSAISKSTLYGIKSYAAVASDENSFMQALVKIGPIVVAIQADYLMDYTGGIWQGIDAQTGAICNPALVDHAVLIVGYGQNTTTNQNYWLIKNSWGSTWGENGYFRMERNSTSLCGLYGYGFVIYS